MNIRYAYGDEAWENSTAHLENLIITRKLRRILEVGGGANPTVSLDFIAQHQLEYTVLDISEVELAKAPEGYLKILADITSPTLNLELSGQYDFIFSKMLAEHVRNAEMFYRNIFRLLSDGGTTFHFFPTLYALPFVLNLIIPERLGYSLVLFFQGKYRKNEGNLGKFPAYYSWCRGPTPGQLRRFEQIGFEIDEYIGFFGHDSYYARVPWLRRISSNISKWLVNHPTPWLTSFVYMTLVKPRESDAKRLSQT